MTGFLPPAFHWLMPWPTRMNGNSRRTPDTDTCVDTYVSCATATAPALASTTSSCSCVFLLLICFLVFLRFPWFAIPPSHRGRTGNCYHSHSASMALFGGFCVQRTEGAPGVENVSNTLFTSSSAFFFVHPLTVTRDSARSFLSTIEHSKTSSMDIPNLPMTAPRISAMRVVSTDERPLTRAIENPGTSSLSCSSLYCSAHVVSSSLQASTSFSRNLRHARRSPRCATVAGAVNVCAVTVSPS